MALSTKMMIRNIFLAFINTVVMGLPVLLIFNTEIYLWVELLLLAVMILLFWNLIGDFILVHFKLNAKRLAPNAAMRCAADDYIEFLVSQGKVMPKRRFYYYTESDVPYFLPLSKRTYVISRALDDPLYANGSRFLMNRIPENILDAKILYSRKALLLTLVGYQIVLRLLELWAIIFSFAVRMILGLVIYLATRNPDAIAIGDIIGSIAIKIDGIYTFLQDKIIDFLLAGVVKETMEAIELESSATQD